METSSCPHCKTENALNQKYCKGCGFTLPNAVAQSPKRNFPLLRPNRERGRAAMYCMVLMLLLMLPAALIQGMLARTMLLIMYADHIPVAALSAGILAQLALSFLLIVVSICNMVLFFMWFRRAYYNLRLIKGKTRYAVGWAVGAWFIPVVHLFMPYQIMNELFRDTKQLLLDANLSNVAKLPKNWVGLWWTLSISYIIATVVLQLLPYFTILPTTMVIYSNYIQVAVGCVITCLMIKIIYDYAKMEKLLNQ